MAKEFLPPKIQETKRLAESLGLKISQRQTELPNQTKVEQNMEPAQLLSFQSSEMVNFLYCLNQIDSFPVISNCNILHDLLQMGNIDFTPGSGSLGQ